MTVRPTSITVIGWILIIFGVLSFVDLFTRFTDLQKQELMAHSPVPILVQYAIFLAGGVLNLVCGYAVLQGKNWARYLYVIWTAIQFLYGFATWPVKLPMIPGLLIFLLFTYFLFRPQVHTFFTGDRRNIATQTRTSTRQILSVCCYVVAGFFLSINGLLAFAAAPENWMKWTVLGTFVVPALVFLVIGRALSVSGQWEREVGVVLVASAATGSLLAITAVLMFMDPEFQKTLPAEQVGAFRDFTTGIFWVSLVAALGALTLFQARKKGRREAT